MTYENAKRLFEHYKYVAEHGVQRDSVTKETPKYIESSKRNAKKALKQMIENNKKKKRPYDFLMEKEEVKEEPVEEVKSKGKK